MSFPKRAVYWFLIFFWPFWQTAIASSSSNELIPRSLFFENETKTNGRISPDGKWISWLAPNHGVLNVWVAPSSRPASAKPVTNEKTRSIRRFFWAKSSKFILFTNDHGGDENYQLFSVTPDAGRMQSYTPTGAKVVLIALSRKRPDEVLIGLNTRDRRYHDVYLLDLITGQLTLKYENNEFSSFIADTSLNLRFASKSRPDGAIEIRRFEAEVTSEFAVIPREDSITTGLIGISDDGRTLYWRDSRNRDKSALVAEDLITGAAQVIGQSLKADVANVLRSPSTGSVDAYSVNYLKEEWFPVGNDLKPDISLLNSLIHGQWTVASRNDADTLWVISVDEVVKPITFFLFDRKAKKLSPLFVTRPPLLGRRLAPMMGVEIRARDGLILPSFLTLPVGVPLNAMGMPRKPLPLVLNVHGGPWWRDWLGYDGEAQWLANRGYAVLQVNYRGSTGFGKSFVEAATREFAGKMHDDLLDAVKWAIDRGVTTSAKVAIYGMSYGGYATLVGLTFTPTTFACGIDLVGMSNLVTLIESFPAYWKPQLQETWYRRVGDPSVPEDRALLLARSPVTRAEQIERPLLIVQGVNDPRVPQRESDQIVAAMRSKQIPVTYVLYSDEGHGFARAENRISFYAISEAFLAKCLGGRVEPIGKAFLGAHFTIPYGIELVPGVVQSLDSRH